MTYTRKIRVTDCYVRLVAANRVLVTLHSAVAAEAQSVIWEAVFVSLELKLYLARAVPWN